MRILSISYLFPNSQQPEFGIFVLNRLKALSKYCELKVVNPVPWFPGCTIFPRYRPYARVPLLEQLEGLEVYHPRFLSIPRYLKGMEPRTFYTSVFSIIRRLQQKNFSFDLIDVHWIFPDLPASIALSRYFNKKIVATLRGKEALLSSGQKRFRSLLVPALENTDHVISLSKEMIDLCKEGGVSHNRFSVIRNGADTQNFFWIDRNKAREKLDLPQNQFILLSVGSLIYRKGFDRIIENLNQFKKSHPNIAYYIIGSPGPEGNYESQLKRLCKKYGVENRVVFAGHVPNGSLVYWYNAADIFCLTSRGEGSPNVLSEALTCGCPSVATRVGSASDILRYPWMGELVSNSKEAIFKGVMAALNKEFDRKAIASYMAQFDWDWCAKKVLKVFKSLCGNYK